MNRVLRFLKSLKDIWKESWAEYSESYFIARMFIVPEKKNEDKTLSAKQRTVRAATSGCWILRPAVHMLHCWNESVSVESSHYIGKVAVMRSLVQSFQTPSQQGSINVSWHNSTNSAEHILHFHVVHIWKTKTYWQAVCLGIRTVMHLRCWYAIYHVWNNEGLTFTSYGLRYSSQQVLVQQPACEQEQRVLDTCTTASHVKWSHRSIRWMACWW